MNKKTDYGRTDVRTDETDRPFYKDAKTHLKMVKKMLERGLIKSEITKKFFLISGASFIRGSIWP